MQSVMSVLTILKEHTNAGVACPRLVEVEALRVGLPGTVRGLQQAQKRAEIQPGVRVLDALLPLR